MEQLSMLLTAEERAYYAIRASLEETLKNNGLDESYISLEQRRTYHSVLFDKSSVVVRISSHPTPIISVPTSILAATSDFSSMVGNASSDYTKIKLPNLDNIHYHVSMIQSVLQGIIDRIPKDYDCCSRYMECSDARRCTHPDKAFALRCGYRKILRSGNVFYGENRNID